MHFSKYQNVFFIEGTISSAKRLGPISTELNDMFAQNQLKSLDDLKSRMCDYVCAKGGNAVLEFKYGQKSTFWKSLWGMDDVMWYGSGEVAYVDPASIEK